MNKKQKEIIAIFMFLAVVVLIVINWNTASWIFNYKEVGGIAYDFFNPYPNSNLLTGAASQNSDFSDSVNSLSIPSISVATPVVIGQSTDDNTLEEDLDQGAVYYPGSVLPGQNGQIIILGHSAPPNWPPIKHDFIFSNLQNLTAGDEIILTFNHTPYTYVVKDKEVILQGQNVSSADLSGTGNVLTLISCWPPGKNYERIAVTAQLQS